MKIRMIIPVLLITLPLTTTVVSASTEETVLEKLSSKQNNSSVKSWSEQLFSSENMPYFYFLAAGLLGTGTALWAGYQIRQIDEQQRREQQQQQQQQRFEEQQQREARQLQQRQQEEAKHRQDQDALVEHLFREYHNYLGRKSKCTSKSFS